VVLADEPTGNLDEDTGESILSLLLELTRDAGKTLIMATHNPEIVPLADRVCRIHDGKLVITRQDSTYNADQKTTTVLEDGHTEKDMTTVVETA
jgi:ABC-type lipoprotein export system ATPase subunit